MSDIPEDVTDRLKHMLSEDRVRQIVREEVNNCRDPEISKYVGKGCAWAAVIFALGMLVHGLVLYWRFPHE